MDFKRKKHFVWLLAISFLLTQIFLVGPLLGQTAANDSSSSTDRISGTDRYKTAVAVSKKGWKTSEYAVLARGDNFADALCAGPLAQKYGGPILLTQSDQLNTDTLNELKRLGVKHLFIAGGTGAVSQSVENSLKSNGIETIERIYGNDRYETSVKIAEKLGVATTGSASGKAVLATGSDFPDALSISSIAANLGMPILLTAKDSLPASVREYFQANTDTITQTHIVGGTGVISNAVGAGVPGAVRLAGDNRYETNIAIMQNFAGELNFERIYVAAGTNFADALTGGVLAAKNSAPLVLAGKTLTANTADYLQTKLKLSTKVLGLGGKSVVPSSILTGLVSAKEQIAVQEKYSTAGIYGPETGTKTIQGSVIISSADVTLRNTIIEGDLLLGISIGDGDIELRDVTVQGKTIVNGGGPNSVIMYNFNGVTVIVDVPDGANVRLVAQGNTTVANVSMEGNGMLQEAEVTGSGFITVAIPAGAEVVLNGDFNEVNVESEGANVTVASGSITTMNISETATGAGVNLVSGSSVSTLNANAQSSITGQGQITNANVNTSGVTIVQKPTNTTVASGVTANVGGEQVDQNTLLPPVSSGGGGSGSSSVSATPITAANTAVTKGSIQFNYTFEENGNAVTYGEAKLAPYYLNPAQSMVVLKDATHFGNLVPLGNLDLTDDGTASFADFEAVLAKFTDLNWMPTHIKLNLVSHNSYDGSTISNPWNHDTGWLALDAGTDVFKVYADKHALRLQDAGGKTIDGAALANIISDLTLVTTGPAAGSTISWQTSDSGTISTDGFIDRPAAGADKNVTLTATIQSNGISETKEFAVTVKQISATAGNATAMTTNPANGAVINSLQGIAGTATDADGDAISSLMIAIEKGTSEEYLCEDGTWGKAAGGHWLSASNTAGDGSFSTWGYNLIQAQQDAIAALNGGSIRISIKVDDGVVNQLNNVTIVTVDATAPSVQALGNNQTNGLNGFAYDAGDELILTFNEPIEISNLIANSTDFSRITGVTWGQSTITANNPQNGYASTFSITLGSGVSIAANGSQDIAVAVGAAEDVAGNTNSGNLTFDIPKADSDGSGFAYRLEINQINNGDTSVTGLVKAEWYVKIKYFENEFDTLWGSSQANVNTGVFSVSGAAIPNSQKIQVFIGDLADFTPGNDTDKGMYTLIAGANSGGKLVVNNMQSVDGPVTGVTIPSQGLELNRPTAGMQVNTGTSDGSGNYSISIPEGQEPASGEKMVVVIQAPAEGGNSPGMCKFYAP